jgi:hypothetical protein
LVVASTVMARMHGRRDKLPIRPGTAARNWHAELEIIRHFVAQPWDAKLGLLPAVEAMQVAGGWGSGRERAAAGEVKVHSCTGVPSSPTAYGPFEAVN